MEHRLLQFLLPFFYEWGYALLLLLTFLETSALLGLLVPGESMVVIAGLLASQRVLELGDRSSGVPPRHGGPLPCLFFQEEAGDRSWRGSTDRPGALRPDAGGVGLRQEAASRGREWYGLQLTLSVTLFLLALLSFGEIVEDLIDRETLFRLDFQVQHVVERIMTPALTRVMVEITQAGGVGSI